MILVQLKFSASAVFQQLYLVGWFLASYPCRAAWGDTCGGGAWPGYEARWFSTSRPSCARLACTLSSSLKCTTRRKVRGCTYLNTAWSSLRRSPLWNLDGNLCVLQRNLKGNPLWTTPMITFQRIPKEPYSESPVGPTQTKDPFYWYFPKNQTLISSDTSYSMCGTCTFI